MRCSHRIQTVEHYYLACPDLPIGAIDYYGLRTVSEEAVSQVLGIAVGDTLAEPSSAIVERIEGVPGVEQARAQLLCCMEGKGILYVGVAEPNVRGGNGITPPPRSPNQHPCETAPIVLEEGGGWCLAPES